VGEQEIKGPFDSPVGACPGSHPLTKACWKHGDLDKLRVAVLFECDDCCIKASGGRIAEIVDGFLVLVAKEDSFIVVKAISDGELVDKELVKVIIIPVDKICAVEIGALQIDP